jgi:hypothetical protein
MLKRRCDSLYSKIFSVYVYTIFLSHANNRETNNFKDVLDSGSVCIGTNDISLKRTMEIHRKTKA